MSLVCDTDALVSIGCFQVCRHMASPVTSSVSDLNILPLVRFRSDLHVVGGRWVSLSPFRLLGCIFNVD